MVKEYTRIAYGLLLTQHVDIHRTARQMVRPCHTTNGPIHRLRTISAIDDNRLVTNTSSISLQTSDIIQSQPSSSLFSI